jgi:thiamine-monophosphate kinase
LSEAVRAALSSDPGLIERILTGGDDYEILLTLAPDKFNAFRAAAEKAGVAVTKIGQIVNGQGVRFLSDGKALSFAQPSYSHF